MFPLFSELLADLQINPSKNEQNLISMIPMLEVEQLRHLYLIIASYAQSSGENLARPLYNGTVLPGKGISFQFKQFPSPLQDLILRYLEWIRQ